VALRVLIVAGQEKGKSFDYDQPEVKLGRTLDNDLVLAEAGVSRKHARLFRTAGGWSVEDTGSANGTKLNGQPLSGPSPLKSGDRVTVGPVELSVTVQADEAGEPEEDEVVAPPLEQSTRIVSASQVAHDPAARVKTGQLGAVPPRRTGMQPALGTAGNGPSRPGISAVPSRPGLSASPSRTGIPAAPARPGITQTPSRPGPQSPPTDEQEPHEGTGDAEDEVTGAGGAAARGLTTRPPPGARPGLRPAGGGARGSPQEAGEALERLRARREHGDSLGGQLASSWSEASPARKATSVLLGLLVLGGAAAGLVYVYRPTAFGPTAPEPLVLGRERITASFGYGDGVDYRRVDEKSFEFEYASAGKAVALLHCASRNISEGEVNIVLNGVIQGQLPPDTLEPGREYEQVFSARDLHRGQKNTLSFDNVKNPPGREEWAVSGIQLEVIPIPDAPEEQLAGLASESARKASQYYDLREVGPENLFRAWKTYRSAWLYMEAMTSRPELYSLVRDRYRQVSRELDNQCARLLLEVQKSVQLKNISRADKALERVLSFFPTTEHRCNAQSRKWRSELDYNPEPED